jgi:hypothetical protein
MSFKFAINNEVHCSVDHRSAGGLRSLQNSFSLSGRSVGMYLRWVTLLAWLVFSTFLWSALAQIVEKTTNGNAPDTHAPTSPPSGEETGPASEQTTPEDFALHGNSPM